MSLKSAVLSFLKRYNPQQKSFLVALSGGPDSMALFHTLTDIFRYKKEAFAVAHVDHQWRQESRKEAKTLALLAEKHQVPFFLERLNPEDFSGNLEAYCRCRRLEFFKDLVERQGFAAAMLAHHADDVAEGVFKRLFEGKSLPFLRGMKPESIIEGLRIWRPFLQLRKKQLIDWLDQSRLEYFLDSSNEDPRFLRGRMRRELLPTLAGGFGKEAVPSLIRISEESVELETYFDSIVEPLLETTSRGAFGFADAAYWIDLNGRLPGSWMVTVHFLRRWIEKIGIDFPGSILKEAAKALHQNSTQRKWDVAKGSFFVDRSRAFILPLPHKKFSLKNKYPESERGQIGKKEQKSAASERDFSTCCLWNRWRFAARDEAPLAPSLGGWKQALSGRVELTLPRGDYRLMSPEECMDRMKKLWTERQVPAFMRYLVPLIADRHGNVYEALSGRCSYDFHRIKKGTRVILEFSSKDRFC